MPRPKPSTWRAATWATLRPAPLAPGPRASLADALGRDTLDDEAHDDCAALVAAWPRLREDTSPTHGQSWAALGALAAQARALRDTVRTLDDDTRGRLALVALRAAQHARPSPPSRDPLRELVASLRRAEGLCEAAARTLDAEPALRREKHPGRAEWLAVAVAVFAQHTADPRSAKLRRVFVARLARLAGVPLPRARVLDRLLGDARRVPADEARAVLAALLAD